MSFQIGDRVILINGTPQVPSGSRGRVSSVAGSNVQVDFGVLGFLLTVESNLQPDTDAARVARAASAAAADAGAGVRKLHWTLSAVDAPSTAAPASVVVTPAPSNAVSILFNTPSLDVHGAGPLAAMWGTTLSFALSGDLQKSASIGVDVRGHITTTAGASAVVIIYLGGKMQRKAVKRGNARSDDFTVSLHQNLPANATAHFISLAVFVDRTSTAESVLATIDAVDIALR